MKPTAIKDLITQVEEWMLYDKHVQDNPLDYEEYMVMHANQMIKVKGEFIDMCKSMLYIEREQMCDFAEQYFLALGYKSAEHYFDRVFNTDKNEEDN